MKTDDQSESICVVIYINSLSMRVASYWTILPGAIATFCG